MQTLSLCPHCLTLNTFYFTKPAIFSLLLDKDGDLEIIMGFIWEKNDLGNNHKLFNISLTCIETAPIIIVVHTGIVVRE